MVVLVIMSFPCEGVVFTEVTNTSDHHFTSVTSQIRKTVRQTDSQADILCHHSILLIVYSVVLKPPTYLCMAFCSF